MVGCSGLGVACGGGVCCSGVILNLHPFQSLSQFQQRRDKEFRCLLYYHNHGFKRCVNYLPIYLYIFFKKKVHFQETVMIPMGFPFFFSLSVFYYNILYRINLFFFLISIQEGEKYCSGN